MSGWRGVLAELRRTESRRGRQSSGRFRIEGTRLHERALRARAGLEHVLVGAAWAAAARGRERALLDEIVAAAVPIQEAPDEAILELTEGRETGALAGLVAIPGDTSAADLVAHDPGLVLLVAVDVEDPGNVGALVRTALACGAGGFVAAGVSDPYHPKAVRTSMGSLFRVPVVVRRDAASVADELESIGVAAWAAVSRGGESLAGEGPGRERGAVAIVVGSEAFGLSPDALGRFSRTVSIPMPEQVDSLSVNAAAAVLLWEVRRSRLS